MGTVSVLGGALQPYAWGRRNAMNAWLVDAPEGPHAELWFGAHVNAPSPVLAGPEVPGEAAPLLVKLLAAGAPLSIQVHPDAEGVARLSADLQTSGLLADGNIKSEVLIALEPFAVLAGLRAADEAAAVLEAGFGEGSPVVYRLDAGDIPGAIRTVFAAPTPFDADAALAALTEDERMVMAKVVEVYRGDVGLPVAFMMRPRTLQPGQALFVAAGCLHAYVDGFGVEVMTSSDNVLRLGLTPKQVAVEPALSILDVDLQPVITEVSATPTGVDAIPFTVQRLEEGSTTVDDAGAIVLCVHGVAVSECEVSLEPGRAGLLHSGTCQWSVSGQVYIARPTQ